MLNYFRGAGYYKVFCITIADINSQRRKARTPRSPFSHPQLRTADLVEKHGPFSCYGQIKANNAAKELNVTNYVKGLPNHQRGPTLHTLFL